MGFGFDATGAGGFPNMGMMGQMGEFNPMQMMAMQNGITANNFGAFPILGEIERENLQCVDLTVAQECLEWRWIP